MKIVMTQALCPEAMALLKDAGAEIYVANDSDMHHYLDKIRETDGIVIRVSTLPRDVLEAATNLKVIGRPGVGCDPIDVDCATELGVPVVNTPGANSHAVAEHTLAMIYAISKNLVECDIGTKRGDFIKFRTFGNAFELDGKKVAIIGMGAIGREVARLCKANGMEVLGYDPYLTKEQIEATGATYYSNFEDMLPIADVLTIHVPLLDSTRHLISKPQLEKMKKTAILINNARGPVVEQQALADALNNGVIAGAGVDVFDVEPPLPDNPLFTAKNILLTPHTATLTRETTVKVGTMCARGMLEVLAGKKCKHVANPKVYEHPRWKNV